MNSFDHHIIAFINQFSQQSWIFDNFIVFLSTASLLKGGVLVAIIWWAWFKGEKQDSHNREHIITSLFSCIVAVVVARGVALTLPFRFRPLHVDSLNFMLPIGMTKEILTGWSSFPSDHAVLFFALSTGLLFISRYAGTFALCYTVLVISFPRVYLGLHYPTDIIAGAFIGIIIALLGNIYFVKNKYVKSIAAWPYVKPEFFYPAFFLLSYQIADLFDGSRDIAAWGFKLVKRILL